MCAPGGEPTPAGFETAAVRTDACAPGSEPSPCRLRNSRLPEGHVSTRRARTACRTGYRTTGPAPPRGMNAQLLQTTCQTVPHPTPPAMTHHHHHHARPPATTHPRPIIRAARRHHNHQAVQPQPPPPPAMGHPQHHQQHPPPRQHSRRRRQAHRAPHHTRNTPTLHTTHSTYTGNRQHRRPTPTT